jgi:hypothetical protein
MPIANGELVKADSTDNVWFIENGRRRLMGRVRVLPEQEVMALPEGPPWPSGAAPVVEVERIQPRPPAIRRPLTAPTPNVPVVAEPEPEEFSCAVWQTGDKRWCRIRRCHRSRGFGRSCGPESVGRSGSTSSRARGQEPGGC